MFVLPFMVNKDVYNWCHIHTAGNLQQNYRLHVHELYIYIYITF